MPTLTKAIDWLYLSFIEESEQGYYLNAEQASEAMNALNTVCQYLNNGHVWYVREASFDRFIVKRQQ